ncbi:shikimate O-hydroxycinnamoyltransferase-like [Rutidosis leptorrhynchoides]|uniref:shikimate O-hydroxycinnamoyltransferase-like n=1 Tax=Rutidosis leptorrhynchoides TaxID=125765 RepID=UPI003A9A31AE
MKIVVRESTMVTPAEKTPKISLWNSNLDLYMPPVHTRFVYYYLPNGAVDFFDAKVMKDALSKVLVEFYPVSGRVNKDENGRTGIDCQGQGVLFVEAECDCVIDDLGEFLPSFEVQKLTSTINYALGIKTYPLLVLQVTYFRCGGVSLGVGMHHYIADGESYVHFVNSWSDMARGHNLTKPPFINRTLLLAQESPQPIFEHVEYQPTLLKSSHHVVPSSSEPMVSIFKFSREQLNMLKEKSKDDGNIINCSSIVLLMSHIWKCVCKALGLSDDRQTNMSITVNARDRCQPPLPPGYFRNVVLVTSSLLLAGDIQSKPAWHAASKIHHSITKMNGDYVKSAIDYLEPQPNLETMHSRIATSFGRPNFAITSLVGFPIHDADFGWGRPIFMGPGGAPMEGYAFLLPSPIKDGSLSIVIWLDNECMNLFSELLYGIFTSYVASKL